MMKDILIVCATPLDKDTFWDTAPLAEYLRRISLGHSNIDYWITYENEHGLSRVYNRFITGLYADKIIIFVHDDVCIEDISLYEKINKAILEYDVIGLAGSTPNKLSSPALWNVMGKRHTWSGAVAHKYPNNDILMTTFGPTPRRCLLVDGLFIAINTEKVLKTSIKFDEQFFFHFYDLDFSLAANKGNLKIGTWPIWVVHSGLGDSFHTPEWKEQEQKFTAKWLK